MKWRLVIDFEGERESWGWDEEHLSSLGVVLGHLDPLQEFVGGRVTGFSFGTADEGQVGRREKLSR